MKTFILVTFLFISFAGNAQLGYQSVSFKDWENKKFPSTDWVTINGDTLKKDFFEGKVCFMNFFLNGCVPCMHEIKYINRLSKKYSGNKNVCVIGVYIGTSESYKEFYKSNEIRTRTSSYSMAQLTTSSSTIPGYTIVLVDPYNSSHKYNAAGGPLNVIINKQGIATKTWKGFAKNESDQENTYDEYISEIEKCMK